MIMKELSIEEKAKRYDVAIKVAKSNYETIVQMDNECTFAKEGIVNTFHHMFPELKESEDERISKAIIKHFKEGTEYRSFSGFSKEEVISWLELQGKQNIANSCCKTFNDEQKPAVAFKVGDYIICRNNEDTLYQITDSTPTGYMVKGNDGIVHSVTFEQLINCNAILCVIQKQSPAWSEEDEEYLDSIIKSYKFLLRDYTACHDVDYIPYDSCTVVRTVVNDVNFLKSIKDRLQPKQEWSEKDGSVGKLNEKLRQYREYLIKETESWHKKEEDETLSKIGKQDCIAHANAYISARSKFEDLFNYDSLIEKQGEHKIIDTHFVKEHSPELLEDLEKSTEVVNKYPKTLDGAIELYCYTYGNGKGGFDNLSFDKFRDIAKQFVEDYGKKSPS